MMLKDLQSIFCNFMIFSVDVATDEKWKQELEVGGLDESKLNVHGCYPTYSLVHVAYSYSSPLAVWYV